jgi:hypothetical protein
MVRKRPRPPEEDRDEGDPLGGLMNRYHVSLAGLLLVSGFVALVGLGLVGWALAGEKMSYVLLGIGTLVLLMAAALLITNVFNVGRSLEVRKRGLRCILAGETTELFWEDIADVRVSRTDDTYLGVAGVRRRSSDAVSPSGLLTSTEWEVTIVAHDGRTVRLPPAFLKLVPDVKKLVHQLRLRAGL